MTRKKMIWLSVAGVLSVAAIADAIRYLKPHEENKVDVQQQNTFPVTSATEIIMVYNAWGGIFPGVADFVNKEFFPSSYPCNLCYQTFGTFSMKEEWKRFLDSLPLKKTELHKDDFKRNYQPEDLALPVIMISSQERTMLLVSAGELNQTKNLQQIKDLVLAKLNK